MVPSGGAMYVMLDIRATGLTGGEFGEALLDKERIAIMPGSPIRAAPAGAQVGGVALSRGCHHGLATGRRCAA